MNQTSKGFYALLLCMLIGSAQADGLCRANSGGQPETPVLGPLAEAGDIRITADKSSITDGSRALFDGNVTALRDSLTMRADRLAYNADFEELEAWGDVTVWDKRFVMRSDYAQLYGENQVGGILGADYWLPERRGRGQAEKILKHEDERFDLIRFDYTTCEPGHETWRLEALETRLDFPSNTGVSKHALLRIKGFPILYLPYLNYPITDEPKSGFLAPTFGYSNGRGIDATIPYYWRISPHYDLTFTPRLMADRGAGFSSEFRYMSSRSYGELYGEYLPEDRADDTLFPGQERYFYHILHGTVFSPTLIAQVNYSDASDYAYFQDFGDQRGIAPGTVVSVLPRTASLLYGVGPYWLMLSAEEQKFVLPPPNDTLTTYRKLPSLRLLPRRNTEQNHALNWQFSAAADRLDLQRMDNDQRPKGLRLDMNPRLSYPMRWPGGFVVPKLGVRYTGYDINYPDAAGTADQRVDRLTTTVSADMGLYFEREWLAKKGSQSWLQTLEPRVFYQYTPYEEQSTIPLFDTAPNWFLSWAQLFSSERYSGPDRVKDEHSVALALSSRLIDQQTGLERFRAGIGQIHYLADRKVVGIPSLEDDGTVDHSQIITEVAAQISARLSAAASVYWNQDEQRADYQILSLRYLASPYKLINLSYHHLNHSQLQIEQADVSFRWPLNRNWRMLGRWNYSFEHDLAYESVLGIEYDSCCWAIRVMGRRYLQDVTTAEYDSGIYFQIELKGLAGVGNGNFLNDDEFALTMPGAE